jgi:putative transcriptional regulator
MSGMDGQFLGDELLLGYLQGKLSPAEALLVATQYHMCPVTRKRLLELNTCASQTLESLAPRPVSCCPYEFFEQKCRNATPEPKKTAEDCAEGMVPKPLRPYIGACFDSVSWTPIMPGVGQKRLKTGGAARATLMRIAAGKTIPEHAHRGDEYTLVLRGSFVDGPTHYPAGHVAFHGPEDTGPHAPTADQECICLVVMTGPVAFSGWLGRVLNPLLRLNY